MLKKTQHTFIKKRRPKEDKHRKKGGKEAEVPSAVGGDQHYNDSNDINIP